MKSGLEPVLGLYVAFEGNVFAHLYCDNREDEQRLLLDLERRTDLLGELALALDGLLIELRHRREDT